MAQKINTIYSCSHEKNYDSYIAANPCRCVILSYFHTSLFFWDNFFAKRYHFGKSLLRNGKNATKK